MIRLDKTLRAWGTPDFEAILKHELAQSADQLPLQQGLSTGNYVAAAPITVMINSFSETNDVIRVQVGIFYEGVIGGCSCSDDPTTASEIIEYCEMLLEIDKTTAVTAFVLLS